MSAKSFTLFGKDQKSIELADCQSLRNSNCSWVSGKTRITICLLRTAMPYKKFVSQMSVCQLFVLFFSADDVHSKFLFPFPSKLTTDTIPCNFEDLRENRIVAKRKRVGDCRISWVWKLWKELARIKDGFFHGPSASVFIFHQNKIKIWENQTIPGVVDFCRWDDSHQSQQRQNGMPHVTSECEQQSVTKNNRPETTRRYTQLTEMICLLSSSFYSQPFFWLITFLITRDDNLAWWYTIFKYSEALCSAYAYPHQHSTRYKRKWFRVFQLVLLLPVILWWLTTCRTPRVSWELLALLCLGETWCMILPSCFLGCWLKQAKTNCCVYCYYLERHLIDCCPSRPSQPTVNNRNRDFIPVLHTKG